MKGTIIRTGAYQYILGRRYGKAIFQTKGGMEFDIYIRLLPNLKKKGVDESVRKQNRSN